MHPQGSNLSKVTRHLALLKKFEVVCWFKPNCSLIVPLTWHFEACWLFVIL